MSTTTFTTSATSTTSPQAPPGPLANRLAHETSPYLLQHAQNPVDWYPWGEAALARARAEDRPILLSIGYSACHWCHVMAHESFEAPRTAALMNAHFVNIKVDREERPDLDTLYMAATQAMSNGHGGWPMTVFLTPDLKPFFAGTYFPPVDSHGMPGFTRVLTRLAELWEKERHVLLEQADGLTHAVREQVAVLAPGEPRGDTMALAVQHLGEQFDPTYGGFGGAPKFPHTTSVQLLLAHHARTGEAHSRVMAGVTLAGMAKGGMYDHIGGGFARYSTDVEWLVPHFEKMLYDNALLAKTYLYAWQVTGDPLHAQVARATLDYVLRDMTAPEGGFFSATDADSEGEEGKFYVWQPEEVRAVLGAEEARRVCAYFDIRDDGNWEGASIPNTPRGLDDVARELGIPAADLEASVAAGRSKLYEARRQRVAPGLDDKILTAWNGLMLGSLSEGGRILGAPHYVEAAARAADFLLQHLRQADGTLLRTSRQGRAHLDAYLEDYAYLAEGLVDLYEAGGAARFLEAAIALADTAVRLFNDPTSGAFYDTASTHEVLLARARSGHDGATPSPNATMAHVLARLAHHTGRQDLRTAAERAITAYGANMSRMPWAFARALLAWDFLITGPVELAIVGDASAANYAALVHAANRTFLPNRVFAHTPASAPLLAGKQPVHGHATLYICKDRRCGPPITDPQAVSAALGS